MKGQFIILIIFGILLSGCAVGPKFSSPKMANMTGYALDISTGEPSAGNAGYRMQAFAPGEDIPAQWWELFHSKALDTLIKRAIANSPTLTAARDLK